MSRKRLFSACLTIAVSIPASAGAGGLDEWSIVASTNVFFSPLVLPGLPAFNTSWSLDQVLLNDAAPGADAYFDLERNGATELWHWAQDELEPYARVDGTGAIGPGRVGSEASHVFRLIGSAMDSGADGRRVFAALAGPPVPASTSFATYGLWVHDGQSNAEIARGRPYQPGQVHDPLDPADPDYRFQSSQDMVKRAWIAGDGSVVFAAGVVATSGSAVPALAVVRNDGVNGNQICAISGQAGMGQFDAIDGIYFGESDEVFVRTNDYPAKSIHRVCDGSPQELVREYSTGGLGPQVESSTARFSQIEFRVFPDGRGSFYFAATVTDPTPGAWTGRGIFRHIDGVNLPVARTGLGGVDSSGYHGKPFSGFPLPQDSMQAAGNELVFKASVAAESGPGSIWGFWRVGADGKPEPIAIEGSTEPGYSPYSGSAWDLVLGRAGVFKGGDVVLWGKAYPDAHYSLWRLRRGQRPVRILDKDFEIQAPVASGWAYPQVVTLSIPHFGFLNHASDGWLSRSGYALMDTHLSGYGSVYVAARVADVDYIFANGVEGW